MNRALKRTVLKSGIDRNVRVHDLRHTCGSLMCQKGVSAKEIHKILGHVNKRLHLISILAPTLKD